MSLFAHPSPPSIITLFFCQDSLDAQGNINLIYNPYSWSQVANVLYVEQPKGVGFSYCVKGVTCNNNDTSVGVEFADFVEQFFAGFPEYAKNDFYITGESYAGASRAGEEFGQRTF